MNTLPNRLSKQNASVSVLPMQTENASTPIIRVECLSCFYGPHKAVERVYLNIYERQVTAIIGPSGCGKSTFLKTLNRIGEMESNLRIYGRVEILGRDIYSEGTDLNQLRRQVGMIFQSQYRHLQLLLSLGELSQSDPMQLDHWPRSQRPC